jgi:integrase
MAHIGDDQRCPGAIVEEAYAMGGVAVRQFKVRKLAIENECDSIGGIVKRAAKAGGYNVEEFAGHSLPAGLATQAAANGVSERLIMKQTRHRSLDTLRRYIRQGTLFRENATAKVSL